MQYHEDQNLPPHASKARDRLGLGVWKPTNHFVRQAQAKFQILRVAAASQTLPKDPWPRGWVSSLMEDHEDAHPLLTHQILWSAWRT